MRQRKLSPMMAAAAVAALFIVLLLVRLPSPQGFPHNPLAYETAGPEGPEVTSSQAVKRRKINGLDTLWELPPGPCKGVLFFAHGCAHQGTDFWPPSTPGCPDCLGLPEELAIRSRVLARGYAFVAITSMNRQTRCWDTTMRVERSEDGQRVPSILRTVMEEEGLESLPLFAAGASSGGAFALMLPHLMKLHGVCAQIAALKAEMYSKAQYPPTLFIHMPRDERIAALVEAALPALKATGTPAAEIRVPPRPVTAAWLSQQSEGISSSMAEGVVKALADGGMLDEQGYLREDPRETAGTWQQLVRPVVGGLSLVADASPVSELLNLAYSRHEIVSDYTDAILNWLEEGGKKPIDDILQQQAAAAAAAAGGGGRR